MDTNNIKSVEILPTDEELRATVREKMQRLLARTIINQMVEVRQRAGDAISGRADESWKDYFLGQYARLVDLAESLDLTEV